MSASASAASLKLDPELSFTVLRACAGCGAPHPRSQGLDTDVCPACDAPAAAASETVTVKADADPSLLERVRGLMSAALRGERP